MEWIFVMIAACGFGAWAIWWFFLWLVYADLIPGAGFVWWMFVGLMITTVVLAMGGCTMERVLDPVQEEEWECVYLDSIHSRCENKEVLCYSRYKGGLQCQWKEVRGE